MNFYQFLIITIVFTSTEALVHRWTDVSSDGQTTCNYTYKYEKGRDFDAIEELLSESFECGDGSVNCTTTFTYSKTFNAKYNSGEDNLDPRSVDTLRGRAVQMARTAGISYKDSRSIDGTQSCTINPGYRVRLVTKPRYHRLTGDLEEKCLTSCSDCTVSVRSTPLQIEIPASTANGDRYVGSISCKVDPAANIDGMTRVCNSTKLTTGRQFDAVGDVLHRTGVNTANNRVKTLEHTHMDGHDVWAIGMCWNGLGREGCRACIRYLVDNIWNECENSKGAQLWVNDCGVRYEFHRLTEANYDQSFTEQSEQ